MSQTPPRVVAARTSATPPPVRGRQRTPEAVNAAGSGAGYTSSGSQQHAERSPSVAPNVTAASRSEGSVDPKKVATPVWAKCFKGTRRKGKPTVYECLLCKNAGQKHIVPVSEETQEAFNTADEIMKSHVHAEHRTDLRSFVMEYEESQESKRREEGARRKAELTARLRQKGQRQEERKAKQDKEQEEKAKAKALRAKARAEARARLKAQKARAELAGAGEAEDPGSSKGGSWRAAQQPE